MTLSILLPLTFLAIFAIALGWFARKIVKLGGVKGVAFGTRIERTVGEVTSPDFKSVSTTFRVHILGASDTERAIGLEILTQGPTTYRMHATSLPVAKTRELIALLEAACRGSPSMRDPSAQP